MRTKIFISSYFILIFINIVIIFFNGFPSRNEEYEKVFKNLNPQPYFIKKKYECINKINKNCEIKGLKKRILLIGDSKAMSFQKRLSEFALRHNHGFFSIINNSCTFLFGKDVYHKGRFRKRCNETNKKTENYLNQTSDNIIIYNARYWIYSTQEIEFSNNKDLMSNYVSTIKRLAKKNKIIVIMPTPENNGTEIKK